MANIKREARKEFFEQLEKLKEDNTKLDYREVSNETKKEDEIIKITKKVAKKFNLTTKNVPSFEKVPSIIFSDNSRVKISQNKPLTNSRKGIVGGPTYEYKDSFKIIYDNLIVKDNIKFNNLEYVFTDYIRTVLYSLEEKTTESLQDRISNLKEDNTMSNSSAVTTKKMLKEQSFKVGDMVVVGKGTPNEKKGKVEKTNPLKIRTDPTSTMIVHPSMSVELAESFSEADNLANFKIHDSVKVHPQLTSDPLKKRGQIGKVIKIIDKDTVEVKFGDGKKGLYDVDGLIKESFSEAESSDKAIEKADKMLLDAANKISSASTGDRNVDKIVQEVDSFIMNKKKELEQMHSINK